MAPRPNVLVIMTDEERYPPPYENDELAEFRRTQLPARERLKDGGLELHRHYTASTACVPARASLFTGQYPSLHGVTDTDGLAKGASDPSMRFLDPDTVPTMGDWFRAAGYRTYYRGKWHISHADLLDPITSQGLAANDRAGKVNEEVVELYRRAGRLEPYGFTGWVGREPHGPDPADMGYSRDPIFADQVCSLFDELDGDDSPWLAVASFVNPHDIAFSGIGWQMLGMPEVDDTVPAIAAAPSQDDSFDGRPAAQRLFKELWPQLLYEQPTDEHYRRFYLWLHKVVDSAIGRVLDRVAASPAADNTIIVFTSDHGDMVGAHGGMQQKWHTAFDEAIRVPLVISGPGIEAGGEGVSAATSSVDILPTLLGLTGVDPEATRAALDDTHIEAQHLPGRDLSPMLTGGAAASELDAPVYFMTEDRISRGLRNQNRFTNEPFTPVAEPCKVESVIARLDDGNLWKLTHYYDRLIAWENDHQLTPPLAEPPVEAEEWELYDLTNDPEERTNLAAGTNSAATTFAAAQSILESTRETNRRIPKHRN